MAARLQCENFRLYRCDNNTNARRSDGVHDSGPPSIEIKNGMDAAARVMNTAGKGTKRSCTVRGGGFRSDMNTADGARYVLHDPLTRSDEAPAPPEVRCPEPGSQGLRAIPAVPLRHFDVLNIRFVALLVRTVAKRCKLRISHRTLARRDPETQGATSVRNPAFHLQ
jgi:hypothetical protein